MYRVYDDKFNSFLFSWQLSLVYDQKKKILFGEEEDEEFVITKCINCAQHYLTCPWLRTFKRHQNEREKFMSLDETYF